MKSEAFFTQIYLFSETFQITDKSAKNATLSIWGGGGGLTGEKLEQDQLKQTMFI
jgi:hypothetical protein